jgi:phosphate transport system permease protein
MATVAENPSTPRLSYRELLSNAPERSIGLRKLREGIVMSMLVGSGIFTLAITVAIVVLLGLEAYSFFASPHPTAQNEMMDVSVWEFLTGMRWSPLLGEEKHFGVWPLVIGTFKITAIAMMLALPLGLIIAIWLSEYAHPKVRAVIKPVLEVLAGVPTVVFGYFALTLITPVLQWPFGTESSGSFWQSLRPDSYNGLAAGLAVGIMALPTVCSLAEDALRAVPNSLREAAYGVGANRFEASIKVITPAALSGIIAAFLLAFARAIGETMIVALAAGSSPVQIINPTTGNFDPAATLSVSQSVQPMTGYMVQIFLGDAPHGTVEYYSSYAVAATLFCLTFALTVVGGIVRRRFRQVYN